MRPLLSAALRPGSWPAALWVFAPLAIGLLYALAYATLAPRPTLQDLPPADAILVQRFRNLAALDQASFGPRGPGVRAAREMIASGRNVRGLPGVDPTAPVHMILMPRTARPDSTMAVFRLEDGDAFAREFHRSDFIERGLVRHAQHLVRRGDWAAISPNRDDARRLGTGGISAVDLGEDQSLAANVPRLVDHALSLARQYPWRSILQSLGVQVDALYTRVNEATGALVPVLAGDDRVQRIRDTWSEARLWAWAEPGRVRVELTPTARSTPMAEALAALFRKHREIDAVPDMAPPFAPTSAELWVRIGGQGAVAVTARLLRTWGVRLEPSAEEPDPLDRLAKAQPQPGGLLLWAEPVGGSAPALTIGLAGRRLPDLGSFLPRPASGEDSIALPPAAAALTRGSLAERVTTPSGTIAATVGQGGLQMLAFGVGARGMLATMGSYMAAGLSPPTDQGFSTYADAQFRVFATFYIQQARARLLLGRALEPGGFLAALAQGNLHGALSTDGRVVRLEAWNSR